MVDFIIDYIKNYKNAEQLYNELKPVSFIIINIKYIYLYI